MGFEFGCNPQPPTSATTVSETFGDGSKITGLVVKDTLTIASLGVPSQPFLALSSELPQAGNNYFVYPADGIFVSHLIHLTTPTNV